MSAEVRDSRVVWWLGGSFVYALLSVWFHLYVAVDPLSRQNWDIATILACVALFGYGIVMRRSSQGTMRFAIEFSMATMVALMLLLSFTDKSWIYYQFLHASTMKQWSSIVMFSLLAVWLMFVTHSALVNVYNRRLHDMIPYIVIVALFFTFISVISKENWQVAVLMFTIVNLSLTYEGILVFTNISVKEKDMPVAARRRAGKYKLLANVIVLLVYLIVVLTDYLDTFGVATHHLFGLDALELAPVRLLLKAVDRTVIFLVVVTFYQTFQEQLHHLFDHTLGIHFAKIEADTVEEKETEPNTPRVRYKKAKRVKVRKRG